MDARKLPAKAHQQHGDEVLGGADHGQVNAALFHAHMLGHQGFEVLQLAHGRAGVGQKSLARVCQPDVAAHGLDQWQAKRVFELAYLHGHGRLRHKQALGRLGH